MARKSENYLKIARAKFLIGLPYRTPIEAVEAGVKSISEWCDCLNEARQLENLPINLEDLKVLALN